MRSEPKHALKMFERTQDRVSEQMYVERSLPRTAIQKMYIKVRKSPQLKTAGRRKLLGESRRGMRRRE